ncbi:MAG: serine/threonine protein kinase, partial [Acidobacteria bacterium]|nr:serine/threonine protein kinase [Acidobacteriota bacterium]
MTVESLVGQTIGHYLVLDLLGQGGMGVVYKASDARLGRLAALKVMQPEHRSEAAGARRFVREAQTAAGLNHPNILTIYEIGTHGDLTYIAMEMVAGGTLADVIASGPLPAERALRLASQVADALAAAHAASIVHRDLKPSNIMMAAPDRVKVVDFGLAKLTTPAGPGEETVEAVTAGGVIVGTAPYMSPEQAVGRSVDARSDL